jgi:branched-subunit amino acid transport protein
VNAWVVVLLAGLVSYGLRMSMVTNDRLRLPPRLEESVDLVAPAAFSSLAMSALATAVLADHTVTGTVPLALAVVVAAVATARTGRPIAAMLAGAPTYWVAALLTT